MITSTNLIIIIIALLVASIAIYALYSIILFQGIKNKGEELQLSTKNILEQVKVLYDKKEYALVELLSTKYLDRVPNHFEVRIYLAKAYYWQNKYNLAINQCLIILKKHPNNIDAHRVLGDAYRKKDYLNKALKEFEFLYEESPNNKEIVQSLAELYRETEQLHSSISAYNILVSLMTDNNDIADIQSIIAELNVEVHDFPAAFEAYKIRLGIYPKDIDTNKKLAELYVRINNYQMAIETLLFMLSFVTENKLLLWINELLVDLYEETENYEKAIAFSESLLNIQGSDSYKIRRRIAEFNLKLNKVTDGILILEDLAMMSQNAYDITLELCSAYLENNDFQKAFDKYMLLLDKANQREAKQVNVLICELFVKWAVEKSQEEKYDESFEYLRNATQYNILNSEIYYNIAKNDFELKNYTNAVEQINQAIEYDKENKYCTKYLLLQADIHHQLGNFFEEKKALTDLLKNDEKNAEGLYRIGLMFLAQHDIKNAEEALRKAILYEPEHIKAKYNLALIYENNNKDRAKELYIEILEQDPTFEDARNALNDLTSGNNY